MAANRGADSAGLNQYRRVQRQQREANFLSNVDLTQTLALALALALTLALPLPLSQAALYLVHTT